MPTPLNRRWILTKRPVEDNLAECLQFEQHPVADIGEGEILVRTIYLSLDPADRIWMSDVDQYMEPVALGTVMRGVNLGVVASSNNAEFNPGDIVYGLGTWEEYGVSDGSTWGKIANYPDLSLIDYIGCCGHISIAAYMGMLDICNPQAGETVVVSAAAGAVGSIAGQLALQRGARVIGICGGDEKCEWIEQKLGFTKAINYKKTDVKNALAEACPDGIDACFECVGGDILNASLSLMNNFGRVAICGLISTYNQLEDEQAGPCNFSNILMKRLTVKGFISSDVEPTHQQEILERVAAWLVNGELKYRIHMIDGLENAAEALSYLYDGRNQGKLIVKVGEEP